MACAALTSVKETIKCLSCDNDALTTLRPRFRVGTTASFVDEPICGVLRNKVYRRLESCAVDWVICPGDGAAVAAMLNAGIIDMVMTCAEDAAMLTLSAKTLRVCGTFDGSPRLWHVFQAEPGHCGPRAHVSGQPRRLGVPECLSASLVACMLQDWDSFGWSTRPPEIVVISALGEGLKALTTSGSIHVLIWECTEKELVGIKGVCRKAMEPVSVPWKSHAFVCSRETLHTKSATIRQFFTFTDSLCEEMRTTERESLEKYIAGQYSLTEAEIRRWHGAATWTCSADVDWLTVSRPLQYWKRLGVLPAELKETAHATETLRLAPGLRLLGGPAPAPAQAKVRQPKKTTPSPGANSPAAAADGGTSKAGDEDDTGEGPKQLFVSGSRELRLMPRSFGPSDDASSDADSPARAASAACGQTAATPLSGKSALGSASAASDCGSPASPARPVPAG